VSSVVNTAFAPLVPSYFYDLLLKYRRPIEVSYLTNSFCQSKHGYLAANSNYHYLKHLLSISITCRFHAFHIYRQIPSFANSTKLPILTNSIACKFLQYDFTVKVHYMQIPRQPIYCQNPLLADSITCKFTQPVLSHIADKVALIN